MSDAPMLPRVVARGPSTINFQGREIDRLVAFVRPEAITCPAGHRIKIGDVMMGESGLTCVHQDTAGSPVCGAMIWVVLFPAPRHESLFLIADVEYRELIEWQQARYMIEDVLRYLGMWCLRSDAMRAARARERPIT